MSQNAPNSRGLYPRFKRIYPISLIIFLAWEAFSTGGLLLYLGAQNGLIFLLIGACLIALPFIKSFRKFQSKPINSSLYPVLILVGYVLIIALNFGFAWLLYGDPYAIYNPQTKLNIIYWFASSIIGMVMLIVNLIAFWMDRKAQGAI
ncbi:MAG: hypothetical protein A2Z14_01175 [Chloroflexi bacterium RBG_16_48_8]|nr:MAG: hypothetical protein A2Z14_01175 [Chloroflexi bacterium RBG_16_48_8]